MIDALPLLLGPEGYQISRSVRLRSSASAYLNRTLSSGNRQTWTWSGWIKRGALGSGAIFHSLGAGGFGVEGFVGFVSDTIDFIFDYNGGSRWRLTTTPVYRDPSAWYHIVFVADTTNATSGDRLRLYVNGTRITAFSTANYPTQNANGTLNQAYSHAIGARTTPSDYLDSYLTDINFIDGQALTPASFGETNPVTGVWQPKKYTGTYGTNGFYLNFSDNSNNTAATIGKDYSGNGNNWTPNNISVTSGSTYDSMLDVPTQWADGGNGRGNYAVLNPLKKPSTSTISDANLTVVFAVAGGEQPASFALSSGKWYWEQTQSGTTAAPGIILETATPSASSISQGYHYYGNNGQFYTGTSGVAYGSTFTTGDIIGVALDLDTNQITFYKNNVSQGAKSIVAGSYTPDFAAAGAQTINANFGQRPFAYTPPSGFKALNTLNLPEPTIKKGNQYFDISTWTGDQSARTITNSGGMQPDFLWTKSRSAAEDHRLSDAVRGGNGTVLGTLASNTTGAEAFDTDVTGFTSSGFNIRAGTNSPNVTGRTYVGWQWKEGATQGFDIVTYTGNQTAGKAVPHSLGVAPAMIIVKARGQATSWPVYHQSLGATKWLLLNSTQAVTTTAQEWDNQPPSSTNFYVGNSSSNSNQSTNYVAYLFAEVAGFSKFGSYTGNGSTDGPFVFCGFRPRFIMFKRTDSSASWRIIDTAREAVNATQNEIYPNLSNAEAGAANGMDILSNGFKLRGSYAEWNASGGTYVFAAFAESPFKNSLAR